MLRYFAAAGAADTLRCRLPLLSPLITSSPMPQAPLIDDTSFRHATFAALRHMPGDDATPLFTPLFFRRFLLHYDAAFAAIRCHV